MSLTIQTGAHQYTGSNITKYALMLGGMNTTHNCIKQWDPLIGPYLRIFMVRKPLHVVTYFRDEPERFNAFKHLIEYGNIGISGLSNPSVEFEEIKGGYAGKSFEIPKSVTDSTNEITIRVPELNGSLVRENIHTWIHNAIDLDTGITHYGGLVSSGELGYSQANQTAEFILVSTDRTGMKVQYACQLTNCFPMEIPTDHFNGDDPADHKGAMIDIKFKCNKREGYDVNEKAKLLLKAKQILVNSLEVATDLPVTGDDSIIARPTGYNPLTGRLDSRSDISSTVLSAEDAAFNNTYRVNITAKDQSDLMTGQHMSMDSSNWQKVTPSFTDYGNAKI